MESKAIISISSKQPDNDNDVVEVVTPGKFFEKDGLYYAVYDETEISGMEGTVTTLKISQDKFSLIRLGTTTTTMEFEKNCKTLSMYNTPYGVLEIGIDTKDLKVEVDSNGGEIFVDYDMSVTGQKPQKTLLKVNIKRQ